MEPKIPLTLVIPTFNEEKRLPATLQIIAEWMPGSCFDVELIIVDDGSEDGTRNVAGHYRKLIPQLQFLEIPHLGYMNAIITGLMKSNRPFRATLEADCPVHPRMFESFLKDFPEMDIVMGSRILSRETSTIEGKSFFRRVLSRLMSGLFSVMFMNEIQDPQIGFKLYRASVVDRVVPLLSLRHDGLKSAEIIVKALAFGYRIKEVPVHYKHDEDSKCVPKGNYRVVFLAAWALLELWAKSYVEYRRGELPTCPVRFGFLLVPFWRLMPFPPAFVGGSASIAASLPTVIP